ncbi:MAG: hypothetical protein QOC89_6131, partial [Paraburkholderia sp.]|nr:hypothetical protein [Paraburkholderia sp.]
RSACERLLAHADFIMGGDENDRHATARQTPLNFQAIQPRHLQIENDAVGAI